MSISANANTNLYSDLFQSINQTTNNLLSTVVSENITLIDTNQEVTYNVAGKSVCLFGTKLVTDGRNTVQVLSKLSDQQLNDLQTAISDDVTRLLNQKFAQGASGIPGFTYDSNVVDTNFRTQVENTVTNTVVTQVRNIAQGSSDITQKVVFNVPGNAFSLYCSLTAKAVNNLTSEAITSVILNNLAKNTIINKQLSDVKQVVQQGKGGSSILTIIIILVVVLVVALIGYGIYRAAKKAQT